MPPQETEFQDPRIQDPANMRPPTPPAVREPARPIPGPDDPQRFADLPQRDDHSLADEIAEIGDRAPKVAALLAHTAFIMETRFGGVNDRPHVAVKK